MKLTIGFITYNNVTVKYLADFLAGLKESLDFLSDSEYQIFCWDNSENNPGNRLAIEQFNHNEQANVKYFSEEKNLGFSRAYNRLIGEAKKYDSKYFFIINPDTRVDGDALRKLTSALDKDAQLGSVSPKILQWKLSAGQGPVIDSCGLSLRRALSFADLGQGELDKGQYDEMNILGPSGAAGLFRIKALDKISQKEEYFDERFFMYKEDCDLSYRLFLAGYESALVADAIVHHDRTASSSGEGLWKKIRDRHSKSQQIRAWSFLNQHLIFIKHWKKQNFVNKIGIICRILSMLVFSLIFEQFLLKEYIKLFKLI